MKFIGAEIKEQGVVFAVVLVKEYIINNRTKANEMIQDFQPVFPGIPVILMSRDSRGNQTCYGRDDISKFMANVPYEAIPWREYTLR